MVFGSLSGGVVNTGQKKNSPISEIKILEVEKASEITDFEIFQKAMDLYQKLQRSNARTVYASVESYEEFFNDTMINKEDVSFAKIGPEWPKRIKNRLREFLYVCSFWPPL